jgi:hypothetical protein
MLLHFPTGLKLVCSKCFYFHQVHNTHAFVTSKAPPPQAWFTQYILYWSTKYTAIRFFLLHQRIYICNVKYTTTSMAVYLSLYRSSRKFWRVEKCTEVSATLPKQFKSDRATLSRIEGQQTTVLRWRPSFLNFSDVLRFRICPGRYDVIRTFKCD